MGIFGTNPKQDPLNYGEIFAIWTNIGTNQGFMAAYQTFYNHTGDADLRKMIEEVINMMEEENKQLIPILKNNGVGLPPAPPERPIAQLEEIPVGARFNDVEISAALSMDTAKGLMACSTAMGLCTREDIAMIFGQFHYTKAQFGAKLLRLNKAKGWLVPPPLHTQVNLQ